MMKKIFFTAVMFSFFLLSSVVAQENEEARVVVRQQLVERVDSSLVISMIMDLSQTEVASGKSLVYTPIIERGDSVVALPQLLVNGRSRHILYERSGRNPQDDGEFELRRRNGKEQTFDYYARIPFRKWMESRKCR